MSILGFVFFIILFIFVFGFSLIISIIKGIFGIGRNKQAHSTHSGQQTQQNSYNRTTKPEKRKKVFDKDDGEYVDFEEVKEKE